MLSAAALTAPALVAALLYAPTPISTTTTRPATSTTESGTPVTPWPYEPRVADLVVTPDHDLVDGQAVRVTAFIQWGPTRDFEYFLGLCTGSPEGPSVAGSGTNCRSVGGPYGLDLHDGHLVTEVRLPAVVPGDGQAVDCRARPSCLLALSPYRWGPDGATAEVSFAALPVVPGTVTAPAPPAPRPVTARPRFTG